MSSNNGQTFETDIEAVSESSFPTPAAQQHSLSGAMLYTAHSMELYRSISIPGPRLSEAGFKFSSHGVKATFKLVGTEADIMALLQRWVDAGVLDADAYQWMIDEYTNKTKEQNSGNNS